MTTQETAKALYLEVEGTKYAYRVIGNASGDSPPLLVLNHVRSTIDTWDPWIINNLTANGRQLITYDYAGLGIAVAILRLLTLDAPDVVRKLVLAGTDPSFGPDLERPMNEVQSTVFNPTPGMPTIQAFFLSFTTGDEGVAWFNRSISSRTDAAGKDGEPDIALFTTGEDLVNFTQAYLTWDADPVPYALLQSIQKYALVTNGDNDLIVPTKNSYVLARQLPRANFVMFPSSGHGHLFQYAGHYTKLVREFLDGKLPIAPFSSGSVPAFGSYGQYNQEL
ncbi:Alpha/Beta hydrolase protein [Dactylonectria macrodidyma]|uniref:Alpha/Beta hydrolase protein n=1 Tax=Dactylonectria macrodidyma TaxID=307937 RepID=A0A9P9DSX3_9HYPO|nr:Alpha/Beta hydrolase protein [Dactylonectria macrodidyma]